MKTSICVTRQLLPRAGKGLILAAALLMGAVAPVPAINLTFPAPPDTPHLPHLSIAPISIPIGPAGYTGIGMTRLQLRNSGVGDSYTSISQISVRLLSDGAFSDASVTAIRVYFEGEDGDGIYDNGAPGNDLPASTGSPSFSGGEATIVLNPSIARFRWQGGVKYLYVVLDFDNTANTATNLACEIVEVTYGSDGVGTERNTTDDGPAIPALTYPAGHTSVRKNLDNYEVTLEATGIASLEATQTDTRVPVLKLVFDVADDSATADIDSIRLRRLGTGPDVDLTSIALYDDTGTEVGSFDSSDAAVPGASGTLSGGYVTLTPTDNLQITASSRTYFVAVSVASGATVGATIGLEIQNPTADVVFVDTIDDDLSTVPAEYAFVTQGYPYVQQGYFDAAAPTYEAPTPTSSNTFTIQELVLPDTTPPTVNVTIPTAGGRLASINSPILIYWSEDVTGAGDDPGADKGNFVFADMGGDPVDFDVSYTVSSSQYITTITPVDPLAYETIYEITVLAAGIQDKATPPNGMGENYTFLFSTPPEFPPVSEPTAFNNRIVSGGNNQVVILIPQPPGGAAARMSVQVFTTTGKLVRTFYRDTPYSSMSAELPIRWDGTNEQGRALGPGMYFIQIRSGSYKRVLRVLIVR